MKPKAYWIFSLRVGTSNPATLTKDMIKEIEQKLSLLPSVALVEVVEDFEKNPLEILKPKSTIKKEA